ncbi:hypothetical protein AVEN_48588-1 [Araneus ventricosus]|uniref:Uncharacterized protein n=1 Tax=Araneus ventricosus TaxID=182803 RepID=A0A4Y2I126_ARAVE|nr:hypothetical protein AVEN_48588-1 [Araneus ventricosus]
MQEDREIVHVNPRSGWPPVISDDLEQAVGTPKFTQTGESQFPSSYRNFHKFQHQFCLKLCRRTCNTRNGAVDGFQNCSVKTTEQNAVPHPRTRDQTGY